LAWPEGLHCPLGWTDDPAGRYLRDARQVAAAADLAAELSTTVATATPTWQAGDHRRAAGEWDWPRLAVLASASRLFLADVPDNPHLQQHAAAAAQQLHAAEQRLRKVFHPNWEGLLASNAAAGRQLLYRACAAHLVLAQYATRDPGPLWVAYRTCGWAAAAGVATAADPAILTNAEDLEALAELLADADDHAAGSPRRWAIIEHLQDALLWHGQESWTHHRLWDLARHGAGRPWLSWFGKWAAGATFSWSGIDARIRRRLLEPALLGAILPSLHAADTAWTAFLDGLAAGAHQPMLCVLAEPTVYPGSDSPTWLAGALAPARRSRGTAVGGYDRPRDRGRCTRPRLG
jgi:hypothetical protein